MSAIFDHYYWKRGVAKISALVTRVELNLIVSTHHNHVISDGPWAIIGVRFGK